MAGTMRLRQSFLRSNALRILIRQKHIDLAEYLPEYRPGGGRKGTSSRGTGGCAVGRGLDARDGTVSGVGRFSPRLASAFCVPWKTPQAVPARALADYYSRSGQVSRLDLV